MPLEVKELIIRASVTDKLSAEKDKNSLPDTPVDVNAIVAECVEQVLEILEQKKER